MIRIKARYARALLARALLALTALLLVGQPLVVHIDTEGSEYALVPSLAGFIQRRAQKPILIVSMHGKPSSAELAKEVCLSVVLTNQRILASRNAACSCAAGYRNAFAVLSSLPKLAGRVKLS